IPDPDLLARPRRRSRFIAPALLAAAAAMAVLAALRFREAPPGRRPEVAAVARVEPDLVHLPDGSRVEIHPGGEIAERFTPGERRVSLLRGEAYFTVAKNPDRPFVVEANGVAVHAVGTAFNVRLPTDEAAVEVLVTEGIVHVTPPIPRAEIS